MEGSRSSSSSIPKSAWLTLLHTSSAAHKHISEQLRPCDRQEQCDVQLVFLHPHLMRWVTVAGAGGSLVGTNTVPIPSTRRLLLVVAEGEECYPDVTPWPGNVPGQWLHVRLLVSEVAFEPPVVSWWKASIWDHQHIHHSATRRIELANKCLNGSFSVNFQLLGRP